MTKKEFITHYAQEHGITKVQAEAETNRFLTALETAVTKGDVKLSGYFAIEHKQVAERTYQNAVTKGEVVVVPAHTKVKIRVGEKLNV